MIETRRAAKGLIRTEQDTIVLVAGRRGTFNLPGGGLKEGETTLLAFLREVCEETGALPEMIQNIDPLEPVTGPITHRDGTAGWAVWTMFSARLNVPFDSLSIPPGSEITALTHMPPSEALQHPNVNPLAKKAISAVLQLSAAC